jgi:hypothetical protein
MSRAGCGDSCGSGAGGKPGLSQGGASGSFHGLSSESPGSSGCSGAFGSSSGAISCVSSRFTISSQALAAEQEDEQEDDQDEDDDASSDVDACAQHESVHVEPPCWRKRQSRRAAEARSENRAGGRRERSPPARCRAPRDRREPQSRDAAKIAATKELFDRGWGKAPAVAPIEGYDPLEAYELTAEVQEIAAELRGLP